MSLHAVTHKNGQARSRLALAPAVTAFAPVAAPKAATKVEASIADTLATMEGPEIFWGSDGVALGHDEADIKGYDNFDQLASALSSNGVDLSGGEYTLLAPANSAFDKHNNEVGTPITADVLKYHVIEGKKTMDALNSDQKTLNGGTLTAYRKFRKNWLDGAPATMALISIQCSISAKAGVSDSVLCMISSADSSPLHASSDAPARRSSVTIVLPARRSRLTCSSTT